MNISIPELGKLVYLAGAIDLFAEEAGGYYNATDAIVAEFIEKEPRFKGTALELHLNGYYEDWLNQSPAASFGLDRSLYMVARAYQSLDGQN